jgi:hypothetical protein
MDSPKSTLKHVLPIIYRLLKNGGMIRVEVIAIGPWDKKKVHTLAASRVMEFKKEMSETPPSPLC